jgi:SAM-dependent methyltransferase
MKIKNKKMTIKLDIACGYNKKQGYIGVDLWKGADLVCNLEEFPWPFEDNSVDAIFCSHYIEHVPDLVSFANELYRIMKTGAKAEIIAPYYTSIRAWQDPTHVRAISERTFQYFNKNSRKALGVVHYPITADFDFVHRFAFDPAWSNRNAEELNFAATHYFNVVHDIQIILTKRKPENEEVMSLAEKALKSWEKGHKRKAFMLARECLAIESNFDALMIAGEYELSQGKYDASIRYFRDAISIEPQSSEAHAGLVRSHIGNGKRGLALRHAKSISIKHPDIGELLEMYL